MYSGSSQPSAPPPPYQKDTPSGDGVDEVKTSQDAQATMSIYQSSGYLQQVDVPNAQANAFMDGLAAIFGRNEIPLPLISKLMCLEGALLHFKVDDSGSMSNPSSVKIKDACLYVRSRFKAQYSDIFLTRWQEAEDRLHTLVELLAYIPTAKIKVSAFDRERQEGSFFVLDRNGKTPEVFIKDAHAQIDNFFKAAPSGNTPILCNLQNMLCESERLRGANTDQRSALYILTDGEPSGGAGEIDQIKNLLQARQNGQANPVTFLACSNEEKDYKWMHEVEEVCCSPGNAGYVAAVNDYQDEAKEVAQDQGKGFNYTKGLWLLCTLAAAMDPNGLDALNEHEPLTKTTFDELNGRVSTEGEYQNYFYNHPHAGNNKNGVFKDDYGLFFSSRNATTIPSVKIFQQALAQRLSRDMDDGDDDSEEQELENAREAVRKWRRGGDPRQSNNSGIFLQIICSGSNLM